MNLEGDYIPLCQLQFPRQLPWVLQTEYRLKPRSQRPQRAVRAVFQGKHPISLVSLIFASVKMSHKKQGFACVTGNSQAILTGSEKGNVLPAAAGSPMRGRPATPANLHPTFDLVLNYLTSSRKPHQR